MTYSITAKKREGENPDSVRTAGLVPAVVYGPEIEPISVAVDYKDFEKLYNEAGESNLIDFQVEGSDDPIKTIIQDIQMDPVKDRVVHVDFRQIKMGEEMSATIELNYIGEAPAVKELGGTLVKGNDYVNVRCLPKDLVSNIEVDLSTLKTFEDVIKIENLPLPEGMTIVDNPNTLLAKVSAPLTEEQLKAMEEAEAPSVEDVEVEGEKSAEETTDEASAPTEEKKED